MGRRLEIVIYTSTIVCLVTHIRSRVLPKPYFFTISYNNCQNLQWWPVKETKSLFGSSGLLSLDIEVAENLEHGKFWNVEWSYTVVCQSQVTRSMENTRSVGARTWLQLMCCTLTLELGVLILEWGAEMGWSGKCECGV
jgi:hypothetical protein